MLLESLATTPTYQTPLTVQRGQLLIVAGKWFCPGNGTLLWDNLTNLGSVAIAPSGEFNTTIKVPYTTAGKHTLVINDGNSDFSVTLTVTVPQPASTSTPTPAPTKAPSTPSPTPSPSASPSPTIPEFSAPAILVLFGLVTLPFILVLKRYRNGSMRIEAGVGFGKAAKKQIERRI